MGNKVARYGALGKQKCNVCHCVGIHRIRGFECISLPIPTQMLPSLLQEAFLPQGYPESVSEDYLSYQLWDTLQVRGTM